MNIEVTELQFERLIELADEKFKKTDLAFYCGLRNNLKQQLAKEKARTDEIIKEYFEKSHCSD